MRKVDGMLEDAQPRKIEGEYSSDDLQAHAMHAVQCGGSRP